jgi:type IV pilus assembly protein PilV
MNMNRHRPQVRHRARGFTLVEAMIALLALSVGLLGIAGLQLAGLRASNSAAWRSQATYISYDIIERMRLNSANRRDYEIGLDATAAGADRASLDIIDWKTRLAAALPDGDGTVVLDGADDTLVTVTVEWSDARGDNTGVVDTTPLVFTMQSRL